MRYYYYFLACLFLACSNPTTNQKKIKTKPQNPHLEAFKRAYIEQFQQVFSATHTPGAALAIVHDSTILYQSGFGTKAAYSIDSVDVETVFRIGSLSKGFAAILAGILVEQGDLEWTDKLRKYLPEFNLKDPAQAQRINLIHILSQTSGLPYHAYTNLVEAGIGIKKISKEFKKVNLISKEGEIYAYQNAAFSTIGTVLESVEDAPLSTVFEKKLFQPLQMRHASTDYDAIVEGSNIALPHSGGNGDWQTRPISKKYYNAIPAGGINASISDMAKWLLLLLGNHPEIISEQTLSDIFRPRVNTNNKQRYFHDWSMVEDAYYGLGWRILTNNQDTLIYHGGYVNGYRSEILIHPKAKLGLCALTNAPTELANKAVPLFLEEYEMRKDSILNWENKSGSSR